MHTVKAIVLILITGLFISSAAQAAKPIKDKRYYQCLTEEEMQLEIIWNKKQGSGILITQPQFCNQCKPRSFKLHKDIYVNHNKVIKKIGEHKGLPVKAKGMICTFDNTLIRFYIHQTTGA